VVAGAKHIILKQAGVYAEAKLIKGDSGSDRCVVEVEGGAPIPVTGIRRFGDLAVGERVYTVGTPGGFERTLGGGLISGLRAYDGVKLIQTSAPILRISEHREHKDRSIVNAQIGAS
jgi:serine protease Do